ncbi:hypothetical protein D6D25_05948 [Aureobasidium pullulans]|nr:hypothetical protein D6D25_05948 [Aureobasidium pullulans]
MQDKEKRKKAISELREKLTQEMKSQIGAYTQVRNRLDKLLDTSATARFAFIAACIPFVAFIGFCCLLVFW